jgi:hypothetical protein
MAIGRESEEKLKMKSENNNNNRTKGRREVIHNRWIF